MTVEKLLARLEQAKKTPNGWQARCPAHDDKKASLSISVTEDRTLLYCHAGCHTEKILETIGLKPKDLFLESKTTAKKPEIIATYAYTDEARNLLFQTVRYFPKDFRQRHPDGKGGWIWNLRGVSLVPYRLPDFLKHSAVFIVEGEKDADNLWKIGLASTCNPMGAGKWKAEWAKFFEGKQAIILPDLDEPGRQHAFDVGKKLFGHALKIKLIELPKKPRVKDVSDWLAQGGTKAELLTMVSQAKDWHPPGTKPPMPVLKTITGETLEGKEFPPLRWAVPNLLTEGLTILAGRPKKGKSWMGLGLALSIASGGLALGKIRVEKGDALYLALEDNERRLKSRLLKIKAEGSKISDHIHLVTDFPPLQMGGMQILLDWLDKHPKTHLVVIDTLGRILPTGKGNSNQFVDDYQFIGKLQKLAIDRGFALLIIHHIRKQGAEYAIDRVAGTTGITGAADSVWVLDSGKGQASAILHVTGRDIETQELALSFSDGIWSILGNAEEIVISEERRSIIALLQENGPMHPRAISDGLRKNQNTVRAILFQMKRKGMLINTVDGRYCLPSIPSL